MAMPTSGTFHYRVQVAREGPSVWVGEGVTLHPADWHPGLVGYRPRFELTNGRVTLRSTETSDSLRSDEHLTRWRPASTVSYEVGGIVGDLLDVGDELLLRRDAMGAKSLCVVRTTELILALGALTGAPLPGSDAVHIEEDPRTEHSFDYW